MVQNTIGFALIAIALGALALQRLYSSVTARELKRLAERGDQLARVLYRPVAYGKSLRLLLWLVVGMALSAGFVLVIPKLPAAVSFVVLALISSIAFVWLPSLRLTQRTARLAAWFAPAITWVLAHTHAALEPISSFGGRWRELTPHSRLYEKEDLLHLLDRQKRQDDNRMPEAELELARQALVFTDKHAVDIILPRKEAHLVNADDTLGPVLLDHLHKQRQSSFLVYKDSKENIVGSLLMSDAVTAKQGGRVFDLVRSDLAFVHEDFNLPQVLAAFQKTGQHVMVVINKFEEFIGLIMLSSLLRELIGDKYEDDALSYESRSAVAAFKPKEPETEAREATQTPPAPEDETTSPEATEVVE